MENNNMLSPSAPPEAHIKYLQEDLVIRNQKISMLEKRFEEQQLHIKELAEDCDNWKRTAQELGCKVYALQQPASKIVNDSFDNVNHPQHYTSGGIETIDFIRAKLTPEEFAGYCKGNALKYVSRATLKGGDEDLRKAGVYLSWAVGRGS